MAWFPRSWFGATWFNRWFGATTPPVLLVEVERRVRWDITHVTYITHELELDVERRVRWGILSEPAVTYATEVTRFPAYAMDTTASYTHDVEVTRSPVGRIVATHQWDALAMDQRADVPHLESRPLLEITHE